MSGRLRSLAALAPAAAAGLLLAGCASIVPGGRADYSPVGHTLQVVAATGAESRLQFRPDGRVVAAFGERSVTGNWSLQDRQLCFNWGAAPRECWPYPAPFPRGRTVSVTSDRGNVVRVTRL